MTTKHVTAPSLFKKDNWKSMDNPTLQSEIVAEHEKHLAKFEWNASEQLKVSLMVQGTTTEAGWSIAQGGYGVIASVNDQVVWEGYLREQFDEVRAQVCRENGQLG